MTKDKQKALKVEDLDPKRMARTLTGAELRAVHGGVCGTAGTYDSKAGTCNVDSVCY